jgi:hypothetical protein
VRLGVWMPFRRAARELAWFCGAAVGEATARRLTEAAGAAYVAEQTAAAEDLAARRPAPPAGPPVQQLSADGAMVPLVGGDWGEVKMLAIGTVAAARAGDGEPTVRTGDVSYFARMADHATFARLALVEAHRRGTETAGTVVAVADGADWVQGLVDLHRPDAVRVLDFPHALEHLNAAGQATWGVGAAEAAAWLGRQARELGTGDPDAVLAALAALPVHDAADPAAAARARDATLAYLRKRRDQIAYARFRRCGFPIGSGMVESAHKTVVEDRLKGAGMHWAPRHVDPMAALRTAVCADRWDEAWRAIAERRRARTAPRRAGGPRVLSAHQASRPRPRRRPPPRPRVAPLPRAPATHASTRSWRLAFQPDRRAADLAARRVTRAASAKN